MSIKKLPDTVRNSDIEFCIEEYVRLTENKEILRKHWFEGITLQELASEHNKSLTAIKHIIYDIGDTILLKAEKICH